MTVRIDIDEVLFDIANKSHEEMLAEVADPEERYRCEAGTEKREEVLRCLGEALDRLDTALKEFTVAPHGTLGTNGIGVREGDAVTYEFPPLARRYATQADAVAGLVHSYLVNSTLGAFYSGVGRADRADIRLKLAVATLKGLLDSIQTKTKPVRSKPYMQW